MACFKPLKPLHGLASQAPPISHQKASEVVTPITLLLFKRRHTQKLINSLLRTIRLHLLSVVVFILDPNISRLVIVGVFVLKVVAVVKKACQLCLSNCQRRRDGLFVARILHEIIVVGHYDGVECVRGRMSSFLRLF